MNDRAGQPATEADLVDVAALVTAYFTEHPDPAEPSQQVAFGTRPSGQRVPAVLQRGPHRGDHAGDLRAPRGRGHHRAGVRGPRYARAVRACGGHRAGSPRRQRRGILIDSRDGYTPTPALSRAILAYNEGRTRGLADGIVVTPSHNPPEDGGFKYNPPDGGPAGAQITSVIQQPRQRTARRRTTGGAADPARAGADGSGPVRLPGRVRGRAALASWTSRRSGPPRSRIGADPLGGASVGYWGEIADRYELELTVVNPVVDPTFRFMTLDWDGRIRMDCSSPSAMASLISRRNDFAVATGNDTDADRHGIVTPDAGLMNPNHYLAAAIDYLYRHREDWPAKAAVGKTMVSSSMIDRVADDCGRSLTEVPVGFKWFVPGLLDGSIAFGGEESAGASFLRRDGRVWTTDKDGIILDLLAAEIIAVTGSTPSELYRSIAERLGDPAYARIDAPASREQKAVLAKLSPEQFSADELAGEPVLARLTAAPGTAKPLGGIKVVTESGWFAARPSGTEDVYKLYAESFRGPGHLARIQSEAQQLLAGVLG